MDFEAQELLFIARIDELGELSKRGLDLAVLGFFQGIERTVER